MAAVHSVFLEAHKAPSATSRPPLHLHFPVPFLRPLTLPHPVVSCLNLPLLTRPALPLPSQNPNTAGSESRAVCGFIRGLLWCGDSFDLLITLLERVQDSQVKNCILSSEMKTHFALNYV